ncbi:hypothetical protein [Halomicronema hongdechloris]|nr:hypothetical protein [Halomicronema hongdechloris]
MATIISIIVISLSYVIPWVSYTLASKREAGQLSIVVEENLIPAIAIELNALKKRFRQKFHLSENIRITIFIPVRQNFFAWKFQMVCRTKNVPEKELLAKFSLNEGVVGYTFLKNKKQRIEFINFANSASLPSSYRHLTDENKILINRNIQVVLVAAVFQEGSIAGLLAIDSDNSDNILRMEDKSLHDEAIDWIIARSGAIRLLWRTKNNV